MYIYSPATLLSSFVTCNSPFGGALTDVLCFNFFCEFLFSDFSVLFILIVDTLHFS